MTDLKGSEGPRITVIYSNFLGYGSLFGQRTIPTYYHFSPLSPQITDIIYGINKYQQKVGISTYKWIPTDQGE
jgi:hypothetical protein